MEPDYYAESFQKRLKSANPPLRAALRYASPSEELLGKLTVEMLRGKYVREPIENEWHQGVIEWDTTSVKDPARTLRWINAAGRQWRLTPDLRHGALATGADNPYFNYGPASRVFGIVLRRDADGNYLPEVMGFSFNGELYSRKR